jgi:hemerythrin
LTKQGLANLRCKFTACAYLRIEPAQSYQKSVIHLRGRAHLTIEGEPPGRTDVRDHHAFKIVAKSHTHGGSMQTWTIIPQITRRFALTSLSRDKSPVFLKLLGKCFCITVSLGSGRTLACISSPAISGRKNEAPFPMGMCWIWKIGRFVSRDRMRSLHARRLAYGLPSSSIRSPGKKSFWISIGNWAVFSALFSFLLVYHQGFRKKLGFLNFFKVFLFYAEPMINNTFCRGGFGMALITWNEKYSVKIKQFDDQHKKLIDMVNELHDAMKVGKGKDVLEKILAGLIQYTVTHFASEERLMKLHNYPGFEQHKKEHNLLSLQVNDVQKKYHEGNAALSQSVMIFLKEWLQNHIQGTDKNYAPFLNSKGII